MEEYDVVIAGAGPAGLTAGIYAGRDGLKALVLEKALKGGMGSTAPLVMNFPAFKSITGMELLKKIGEQASYYAKIRESEEIKSVEKTPERIVVRTDKNEYSAKAFIIATGTKYRELGVPGEMQFIGKGISYCSICDGMFFRGKEVLVIGGGNSAAEHALHLKDIGCKVKMVHRRDELRAQRYLQEKLEKEGVPIIWNSVVKEIKGDTVLKSVVIHDRVRDVDEEIPVNGVFIAIGETPSSQLAVELGAEVDAASYIVTDKDQKTNVHRVYAAGDVTGGVKQLVVACAEGAVAAVSAYNDIKIEE
ncbi:FAD-dependent oxidoreductase [Methanobacterium congolense]|uniref:Thioredoxin reductase n=1 Tax=Methanobacterium congolense TaxID=118062 RepID=A0A1D3KZR7_9EURY|nr:FAD-dependent oxidoreductase [Methanobacterium congolense]SCG84788.1 Thioredoxin reductase [Methanobacterium congolense]